MLVSCWKWIYILRRRIGFFRTLFLSQRSSKQGKLLWTKVSESESRHSLFSVTPGLRSVILLSFPKCDLNLSWMEFCCKALSTGPPEIDLAGTSLHLPGIYGGRLTAMQLLLGSGEHFSKGTKCLLSKCKVKSKTTQVCTCAEAKRERGNDITSASRPQNLSCFSVKLFPI